MEKIKLNTFIAKYTLGGNVQSVTWEFTDNNLITNFISDDKSLIGSVKLTSVNKPPIKFGVYNTKLLNKMISVLSDTIEIDVDYNGNTPTNIKIYDDSTSVSFMLADLSVIPIVPILKKTPEFQLSIALTKEFSDSFIKAKDALSDTETFTIIQDGSTSKFKVIVGQIGSSTNKIQLNIEANITEDNDFTSMTFSSKYLKEILSSNKEFNNGMLNISLDGLAEVKFVNSDFECKYYLIELNTN
jgi:hypothetical protein